MSKKLYKLRTDRKIQVYTAIRDELKNGKGTYICIEFVSAYTDMYETKVMDIDESCQLDAEAVHMLDNMEDYLPELFKHKPEGLSIDDPWFRTTPEINRAARVDLLNEIIDELKAKKS